MPEKLRRCLRWAETSAKDSAYESPDSLWLTGSSVTSHHPDVCHVGSWVFARDPEKVQKLCRM
jgi:hypothetical protein